MRKLSLEKTGTAVSESGASVTDGRAEGNGSWFRMHWRLVSLFAIIAIAFVLRFAFAYGISAGDNYALSGGSSASSHLRIITEILAGTYDPSGQASLGYPYGAESVYGPLFDYVMAAFAFVVSALGVSDATAAAGTLAWSAPILGALTCIPVYFLGRKIFGDETIAIVSALFYAVFAINIMTTAFSNGTEFPFVCFLVAWTVYFLVCALEAAEKSGASGIKSVFTVSSVRNYTVFTGISFALVVLSWNGFWAIMMAAVIILFFTLLFERLGGREMGVTVGISATVLIIAAAVGAIYYIPLGLWAAVFSGGCLLAVLAVVYSFVFLALEKKPWVLSIPLMIVVIGAVAAVFAVAMPELSSAMIHGNSPYEGSLMQELANQFSRTSISSMASFYGWLTLWFPLIAGVWMLYRFRSNAKSRVYAFTMLWLLASFFIGWFSADYAVIAGVGFSVGTAALIVRVIQAVDLRSYFRTFHGIRGSGFKAGAKKVLNFFPFVTVVAAVVLVAAPTAVYAVDAATPTNDEHANYFGGLGYTINTSDSSLVSATWSNLKNNHTDGALITWYGNSDAASSSGGFSSVTSTNGNGTSAMASAYLSNGGAGAIASMIIRLVEKDAAKFADEFNAAGVLDAVKYIDDRSAAREYISLNVSEFEGFNSSLRDESLAYAVGVQYLTSKLNERQLSVLYNAICEKSGNKISYIEVDSSMIPVSYGDGSYTNTIGYFGDYAKDKYGAPAEFYTVTSTTEMYYQYGYYDQLYYTYNDAFYDTFLWNALLGVTPDQFGYSSNIQLLSSLSSSDGTVKAVPATGMGNFKVAYWHVMYQAKDSTKWVDMDAYEAIKKQNDEGGLINYLSSVVVLEYVKNTDYTTSTVKAGEAPMANVKVAVFEKVDYDPSGVTGYVQRSTAYTDENGSFTVAVPHSGDYLVRYYVGSESLRGGSLITTKECIPGASLELVLSSFTQDGTLVTTGDSAFEKSGCTLTFAGSNKQDVKTVTVGTNGEFSVSLIPDVYTVTVYSANGTSLNTVTVPLIDRIDNLTISAAACAVEITVKDMYGNENIVGTDVKIVGSNGTYTVPVTDGKATAYVVAGTYSLSINNDKFVSTSSLSVTASTKEAQKATLTAYPAGTSAAAGVWSSLGYIVNSDGHTYLPGNIADRLTQIPAAGTTFSGVLRNSGGNGVAGTVAYIDGSKVFVFGADSEGKFSVTVPAGTYTVYATDGNGQAYYGKNVEVKADSAADVEYKMVRAYGVTATVNYKTNMSPTTQGIAYVPVELTVTVGGEGYLIPAITGADGKFVIYVPGGATVKCDVPAASFNGYPDINPEAMSDELKDISAPIGMTLTVGADKVTSTPATDIEVYPRADPADLYKNIDVKLDAYSGPSDDRYLVIDGTGKVKVYKTYKEGEGYSDPVDSLMSGRYSVVYNKNDGLMFTNDTVYLYPGFTKIVFDVTKSFRVDVTKADASDNVTVVPVEKTDGTKGTYKSDSDKYYLEDGYEYYFVVTNSAKDKIYVSDKFAAAGTVAYADKLAEKVTLSGYVGTKVTGKLDILSGSQIVQVDVKDGEYSADLPKGFDVSSMKITASYKGSEYKYSVTGAELLSGAIKVDETTVKNFALSTGREPVNKDIVEILGTSHLENGKGTIYVSITNKNDYGVTYFINGSDAFVLDKAYPVPIAKGDGPKTVPVTGFYNEATLGAGSSSASITVTDISGTKIATVTIPASVYSGTAGKVTVDYANSNDRTVYDVVDGYAYKYAIAIKNTGTKAQTFTPGDISPVDGWVAKFVDADGYYIGASEYEIKGRDTTIVYVMMINAAGDKVAQVPGITVNFKVTGLEEESVTHDFKAQSADVSENGSSASGDSIDNSKRGVPTLFWGLTVLTILVFLLLIWGGMKRGVFSRKN